MEKVYRVVLTDTENNMYGILEFYNVDWNEDYIHCLIQDILLKSCKNNVEDYYDRFSEHISIMFEEISKMVECRFNNGYVKFYYNNCDMFYTDNIFNKVGADNG